MTRFVLSPSVETTTASASGTPALRRTSESMPCPTRNPPAQRAPRRASASSCSSTAVTSQPSSASSRATADPTRPQPITTSFTASAYAFEDTLREGHDEHLAGRVAEHVVHSRREEPRLPPPARRGAEDDQIGVALGSLLDDRLADRTRPHRPRLHCHLVLLPQQRGLGE